MYEQFFQLPNSLKVEVRDPQKLINFIFAHCRSASIDAYARVSEKYAHIPFADLLEYYENDEDYVTKRLDQLSSNSTEDSFLVTKGSIVRIMDEVIQLMIRFVLDAAGRANLLHLYYFTTTGTLEWCSVPKNIKKLDERVLYKKLFKHK